MVFFTEMQRNIQENRRSHAMEFHTNLAYPKLNHGNDVNCLLDLLVSSGEAIYHDGKFRFTTPEEREHFLSFMSQPILPKSKNSRDDKK